MDIMDIININVTSNEEISCLTFQKMIFLYNALEDGWKIYKNKEKYIFTKKHENNKEVFLDEYLQKFITKNFDINKINVP